MAANLIPSSHSFRLISSSGSIPKMEINRRIRKMLWHNTFTDIIEKSSTSSMNFSRHLFTFAISSDRVALIIAYISQVRFYSLL